MKIVLATMLAVLLGHAATAGAQVEVIQLPPLQINGRNARAHTQGLECAGQFYYVTARQEDVQPKRALLLRTQREGKGWEVWDITPARAGGELADLDHPGGMQSDGKRLWVPVAQSVRNGRSLIRVFALAKLNPGAPAISDLDLPVADHIGAVAVGVEQQLVFGASWDTETVYVWNTKGELQRKLTGPELKSRNLGGVPGPEGHSGVAVQDWKVVGERLVASGLSSESGGKTQGARSRLLVFSRFLTEGFDCQRIAVPEWGQIELGQEAMAVVGGAVWYLPEDLGTTNRLFRMPLRE